jgi:nicotinamide phosphoribosyltransferase
MPRRNFILQSDSYKMTHFQQYPPGTTYVHSYMEARGGMFTHTMFAGLQPIVKDFFTQPVFDAADIVEARDICKMHFGREDCFNYNGWTSLLNKHKGRLPVIIRAVPEGTLVPNHNVIMTIENTDPAFPWLTNFLETRLMRLWYPITVATQSYHIRQLIRRFLHETGGDPAQVEFKLHDFGYRGVSSEQSAEIGGGSHLFNFMGTDTMGALFYLRDYYGCDLKTASGMPAFSVPAAEHSTITSWGEDHEIDAFENMLDKWPTGIVAVVSDSYDLYEAITFLWGDKLRDKVSGRNGTLVIRPDSGDPATIVNDSLNLLGEKFSFTHNQKGFKVLPSFIRVIQGDGIDYNSINQILTRIKSNGWAAENVTFGMGGALLQKLDRDTQKFAIKCSAVVVNGETHMVFKNPKTQPDKASKKGYMALCALAGYGATTMSFSTREEREKFPGDMLKTVVQSWQTAAPESLSTIRARIRANEPHFDGGQY